MGKFAQLKTMLNSVIRKLGLSLLLCFPVAVYVSGGAIISERVKNTDNCIFHRDVNFLGIFAFRQDYYDKECGAAESISSILNAGLAQTPPDAEMIALAVAYYRKIYPRIGVLVDEIIQDKYKIAPNNTVK